MLKAEPLKDKRFLRAKRFIAFLVTMSVIVGLGIWGKQVSDAAYYALTLLYSAYAFGQTATGMTKIKSLKDIGVVEINSNGNRSGDGEEAA